MTSVIRVTGAWTQLLGDWLDHEGLSAPAIRAVLARWAPEEMVPLPVWNELLAQAVALRPQVLAPGLAIGAGVQPRHIGVMGYVVLASGNLGEALLAYQRYERLFYGVDLVTVVVAGADIEIRWPKDAPLFNQLSDSVGLAALITFLRRQVDSSPAASLISFVHPAPATAQERAHYEAFFGCAVRFADSYTRVRFPASYLAMPMPHSDPSLRVLLDRQAQALLLALPDSDSFDRALQQLLVKLLPEGAVSLPRVARELCVSVRTLQRRLDARGITWQSLLDRTREQLARQYLADHSLSLGDIALLLGFSEQSAFNRAFRRWTGQVPLQVRRLL
ncbi:MAG: AraC family transcriptional regulator ligand-binding domain-containing protein [Pseudomonas sp.]|uniref:AraC family transcriptional regulator n=1 Tax=Pseudomonas sp. TaxID=306 RepID=UPI0027359178|nr:AraC family transcriptional regulator [Pseudomonas sp.]MDP3846619.1 AraC family transcriptional regulator ligand-binding domain-containing protein [Pseudomonas sp.]